MYAYFIFIVLATILLNFKPYIKKFSPQKEEVLFAGANPLQPIMTGFFDLVVILTGKC